MFENDRAAHRLVGYLEEAMKSIERICNQPPSTQPVMTNRVAAIHKIAKASIERARLTL
jgi:hypothetical protein